MGRWNHNDHRMPWVNVPQTHQQHGWFSRVRPEQMADTSKNDDDLRGTVGCAAVQQFARVERWLISYNRTAAVRVIVCCLALVVVVVGGCVCVCACCVRETAPCPTRPRYRFARPC